MFVCGPLAGLLLFSRPSTAREWGWLLGAILWTALWLQPLGGLGAQVARAGAVFLCGSFLALTLWRPSPLFSRALVSAAVAGAALVVWMLRLGIGWAAVRQAVGHDLSEYQDAARAQWQAAGVPTDVVAQMTGISDTVAQLFPALLAIAAVTGLRLAWAWYHRVSTRPLGAPPPPFPAFRFNDQLVWGWVLALALSILPVPDPWPLVGANLLLLWTALYVTRGLAVLLAGAGRVPRSVIVVLGAISMFLLPFVVGGLTLLGLADTWLDFRRRMTPAN
ncbi:MAG: DUF2232 domain-containing protein [Gemmatimonadales bacterium]